MIFILPAIKPREAKEDFHTAMIMADSSVWTNLNEGDRCMGGSVGGVEFSNGRTNHNQ